MHIPLYPHTLTSNLNFNLELLNYDYPYTYLIPALISTTITLTEEEWAVIASKYKYGIDTNKALKDKLVEFV